MVYMVTKHSYRTPHHWVSIVGIRFELFEVTSAIKTKVYIFKKKIFLVKDINATNKLGIFFLLLFPPFFNAS